jgi:hypothetical protein
MVGAADLAAKVAIVTNPPASEDSRGDGISGQATAPALLWSGRSAFCVAATGLRPIGN